MLIIDPQGQEIGPVWAAKKKENSYCENTLKPSTSFSFHDSHLIQANGDIALAEILHKACIHTRRHQNFPIHILGDFCDELSQPMHDEYLPYLVDNLKTVQDQHMKVKHLQ